jgi:hypothetical protein
LWSRYLAVVRGKIECICQLWLHLLSIAAERRSADVC